MGQVDPGRADVDAMEQQPPSRGRRSRGSRGGRGRTRRVLGFAGLVAVGSTIGTLIRATAEQAFPATPGDWPWTTFWINMIGSFVLGVLLETLTRTGDDIGWRRIVRIGAGTGVIGGFTTYSTYVVEVDQIVRAGHFPIAAIYAVVSLLLGVAAAGAGLAAVSAVSMVAHRAPSRGHVR